MRYDTIQTDITATLKAFVDGQYPVNAVDVVDLPGTQKEYLLPYSKPRITVGFMGSTLQKTAYMAAEGEEETLKFTIEVCARDMYGVISTHSLIETVRECLVGYTPTDCNALELKQVQLKSLQDGTFFYSLDFECFRETVERDFPLPAPEPILIQLDYIK